MAKEARIARNTILAVSSTVMAAVVITLFNVHGRDGQNGNYAKYTFEVDGGTHIIQIDRDAKGNSNTILLGVTSSWTQGVPSKWDPLGSGAGSIRWTATVDCKNQEWTFYSHDTYPHVDGEGDKMGCLLMRPVKQSVSDIGWAVKRPILGYVCNLT